jgi:diaminopropionate ammonia-lyase
MSDGRAAGDVPRLEVLRNPLRGAVPPRPPRTPWRPSQLHQRLPGYAETPLIDLPGLAAELGVSRLMVKDESSRFGLPAFKMLGASWASYQALQALLVERTGEAIDLFTSVEQLEHLLSPLHPLALASATDGNHGRAVARFAAWVGLGARIFVPDGTSPARIAAIESEGATCTVVDGTYEDAVARAAQEAGDDCLVISDTSWPGYETVPLWVIEGYQTIFDEIAHQSIDTDRPPPTHVVVPIGVGALAAAVAQHYRLSDSPSGETGRENARNPATKMPNSLERQPEPVLVGVEPDTANCVMASARAGHLVAVPGPHRSVMAGLNCGMASPVAWPWVSAGFDWFVAGGDDLATTGMCHLADRGVVSGESGAATVGALAALAAGAGADAGLTLSPDDVVLVLSTEGATDPDFYEATVGRPAHQVARFAANH